MIRRTYDTERLYLSKGDQIIYIDNCKLDQHHIDGIRFLYRQYKKKKSGVIINNTSGYNKTIQIVLFIKAMHHLLGKPVLILCQEGAEQIWMEQFNTWTDMCDDVLLESEKPYIKKHVLINRMTNLPAFCRREWGIVVVDGNDSSHQVLGLPFKADYKIWLTAINMKDNLDEFSQIYKWFYPKGKFDKNDFTPDKNSPIDIVDKALLLDAFFEDIVDTQDFQENNSPPIKVSKKNKDATGTKIKRSKRKIYDDDDDILLRKTVKNTQPNISSTDELHKNYDIKDSIVDNNEIMGKVKELKVNMVINSDAEVTDTLNSQHGVSLYYEPDSPNDDKQDIIYEDNSDRLYEMDTQEIDNDNCKNLSSDSNTVQKSESKHLNLDEEQIKVVEENEISINTRVNNPMNKNKDTVNEILSTIDDLSDKTSSTTFETKSNNNEDNLDISRESPTISDEMKNEDLINKVIYENVPCNMTVDDKSEIETKLNEKEQDNESESVTNEVAIDNAHQNIEDKIKKMEETAFKKFKGSILDSLF